MSATCPCCGGAVEPLDVMVDAARGTIARGGALTRLTPQELRVFRCLDEARPAVVSREAVMRALRTPGQAYAPGTQIAEVVISKLRSRLRRLGLTVSTHWGAGYALDAGPVPTDATAATRPVPTVFRGRAIIDRIDRKVIGALATEGLTPIEISRRTGLRFRAVVSTIDEASSGGNAA